MINKEVKRMLERNFNYKDMRVAQREDLYLREKEKKEQLLKDMLDVVQDAQAIRSEVEEGFEKFKKEVRKWVK